MRRLRLLARDNAYELGSYVPATFQEIQKYEKER